MTSNANSTLTLWEAIGSEHERTIQERFNEFHRENPEVYRLFDKFTRQAIAQNRTRFSSDMVMHRIRWYTQVETTGTDFKLNDHYSSRYARLWIANNPEHEGFFEVRRLRSE